MRVKAGLLGTGLVASVVLATVAAAQPKPAKPLDQGPFTSDGSFATGDGERGIWHIDATLAGGGFTGIATIEIGGHKATGTLMRDYSYYTASSQRCVFKFDNGRTSGEIAGFCDSTGMHEVFVNAVVPELGRTSTPTGNGTGTVSTPAAAAAPAPALTPPVVRAPAPPANSAPPQAPRPAATLPGGKLSPNQGPVSTSGTFVTGDGHQGTWRIDALLQGGKFTGTGTIDIGGNAVTAPLRPGSTYVSSTGRCLFEFADGRLRGEVAGVCDTASFHDVFVTAVVPELGYETTPSGGGSGSVQTGPAQAAANGVLPTGRLGCWWWQSTIAPIGGGTGTRQLRPSTMGSLTLSPAGTWQTATQRGNFVREGDRIRFTSGTYAGAVGTLQADNSGAPAVYFEREDNTDASGRMLVDPGRTACTASGQG